MINASLDEMIPKSPLWISGNLWGSLPYGGIHLPSLVVGLYPLFKNKIGSFIAQEKCLEIFFAFYSCLRKKTRVITMKPAVINVNGQM
jgi:hypothetical protein